MMGPTIENDEFGEVKNASVSVAIELLGEEKIIEVIKKKSPELLSFEKTVQVEDHHEILLFTLCRKYFIKAYKELRAVFPSIDRLSKDRHLQIIWRRKELKVSPQTTQNDNPIMTRSTLKKEGFSQSKFTAKKSEAHPGDEFLSFPNQTQTQEKSRGAVFLIKDEERTSYILDKESWLKCDTETEIQNGDCICGFVLKQDSNDKAPLYLQVKFSLPE